MTLRVVIACLGVSLVACFTRSDSSEGWLSVAHADESDESGSEASNSGPTHSVDLDGDGTAETTVRVGSCGESAVCLQVLKSPLMSTRAIPLGSPSYRLNAQNFGSEIAAIGNHAGGPLAEVAVLYNRVKHAPAIAVVDVEAGQIVSWAVAPDAGLPAGSQRQIYRRSYGDVVLDRSSRRLYPFLAPGHEDGPYLADTARTANVSANAYSVWGYMCVLAASGAIKGDGPCEGRGFVRINTAPLDTLRGARWSREFGAYLQDLDGDGWDDINVLFKTAVVTYSLRQATRLTTTVFDVAPASGRLHLFHGGRLRGSVSAGDAENGKLRTVMLAGVPVGAFSDYNCNVSRYVGVLESAVGRPESRRLSWVHYLGFTSNSFERLDPKYRAHPEDVLTRPGDFLNHCVHRFSDGRSAWGGRRIIMFNSFQDSSPRAWCVKEQYAWHVTQVTHQTAEERDAFKAWLGCYGLLPTRVRGRWSTVALDEETGRTLLTASDTYVWGRSTTVLPDRTPVYVVEDLPTGSDTEFSFAANLSYREVATAAGVDRLEIGSSPKPPREGRIAVLDDAGRFKTLYSLPSAQRPRIRSERGGGSRAGLPAGYAELTAEDIDGDGKADILLEDGSWVGISPGTGQFAVKKSQR